MTEQPAAPPLSAAIETAEHFADYFFAVEDEEKRWRRLVRFSERRDAAIRAEARAQALSEVVSEMNRLKAMCSDKERGMMYDLLAGRFSDWDRELAYIQGIPETPPQPQPAAHQEAE